MNTLNTFHGSYNPDDVTFILDPIRVTSDGVEPGALQAPDAPAYSVQISSEEPASSEYMDFFFNALASHKRRLAYDVAQVARILAARPGEEVVLTSLVRAGTPIGVLLHRALGMLGRKSKHYSISATRKRGSDPSALDSILRSHRSEDIVFVDGWTGKGHIAGELHHAMSGYNSTRGTNVDPTLVVLSDLAGVAGIAASADDYLIPAAMLRSIVCGLVSASMLNPRDDASLPDTCLYYEHLKAYDCSRLFVDLVSAQVAEELSSLQGTPLVTWDDAARQEAARVSDLFVEQVMERYGITERNKVKPGINECNRALLTRATEMILVVRDPVSDHYDLANLLFLAEAKGVDVVHNSELPYRAAVLLR